jgi:hypothetical protein
LRRGMPSALGWRQPHSRTGLGKGQTMLEGHEIWLWAVSAIKNHTR